MDINRPQFRICHSSTVVGSHFRKVFTLRMPRYKNTFVVRGILFLSIYQIVDNCSNVILLLGNVNSWLFISFKAKSKMTGEEPTGTTDFS